MVLIWKRKINNRKADSHWPGPDHSVPTAAELVGPSSMGMCGLAIVHLHIPLGWGRPPNLILGAWRYPFCLALSLFIHSFRLEAIGPTLKASGRQTMVQGISPGLSLTFYSDYI